MSANLENSAVAIGLEKVNFHSSPKERPSSQSLQTKNAGEDVELREPLYTISGNENWYNQY